MLLHQVPYAILRDQNIPTVRQGMCDYSWYYLLLQPLTNMLKRAWVGYRIHKNIVSHLLFLDDLKVYTHNPKEMGKYKEIIESFSKDILWHLV